MFSMKDTLDIANKLNINFDNFSVEDFLVGLNIELEHGLINQKTNVTNDNLEMTAKIALAHLNEYPNYYNKEYGLPMFEKFLETKLKWNFNENFIFYWNKLSNMLKSIWR